MRRQRCWGTSSPGTGQTGWTGPEARGEPHGKAEADGSATWRLPVSPPVSPPAKGRSTLANLAKPV